MKSSGFLVDVGVAGSIVSITEGTDGVSDGVTTLGVAGVVLILGGVGEGSVSPGVQPPSTTTRTSTAVSFFMMSIMPWSDSVGG